MAGAAAGAPVHHALEDRGEQIGRLGAERTDRIGQRLAGQHPVVGRHHRFEAMDRRP